MSGIFIILLNNSITAGYLVLAILLLRPLLRKAPKYIRCVLWSFVGLRLVLPFSIESIFSLIPSAQPIPQEILYEAQPAIHSGIPFLNAAVNPVLSQSFAPTTGYSVNPMQVVTAIGWNIWLLGVISLILYALISYICLRRKLREAVKSQDNIWLCDRIPSPFLLGFLRPRIYLPSALPDADKKYVIAHENAHIRRKDHWWKPLGFFLLTFYWFSPLMWVGYVFLCRDIEFACDEKVIRELGSDCKVSYSQALIHCSIPRKMISACPVAFGEEGVKGRIKSVLHYKKPAFWIILISLILCAVVAVCFLTDPIGDGKESLSGNPTGEIKNPWVQEYLPGTDGIQGEVDTEKYLRVSSDFEIGADRYGYAVFKTPHQAFQTFVTLYAKGLSAIQQEFDLEPISQQNYALYKTYGWQTTSGSAEALKQAAFVSGFLDIYENSFTDDIPKSAVAVEEVITTDLKTYYRLSNGTWRTDGRNYRYRLEITGRMHNAAVDSVFIYLSNLETITFDQAWKAAGLSSNTEDYFSADEAVLVDLKHIGEAIGSTVWYADGVISNDQLQLSADNTIARALTAAILEKNGGNTSAHTPILPIEAHYILGTESKSGTPLAGQTNHIEEVTVYTIYVHNQYAVSGGNLEVIASKCTPAAIVFLRSNQSEYTVKEFWEPNPGSTYTAEISSKFPRDIAETVLDTGTDGYYANELNSRCLSQAEAYLAAGSLGACGVPVAWIHEKGGKNSMFRFRFDVPYTKMEVSCDNGQLVDADSATNQAIRQELTLDAGISVYWTPFMSDGCHQKTTITFTLYDSDNEIYHGTFTIRGQEYQSPDSYAYVATLNCSGLRLDVNAFSTGGIVTPVNHSPQHLQQALWIVKRTNASLA